VLVDQGKDVDFSTFEQLAYEDMDFELLFEPHLDGIEDTVAGQGMAIAYLHFDQWFTPFREENPVHPYVTSPEGRRHEESPLG
jgi:hypothetical protein